MFEKAARLKLRFETTKGLVCVEDLWDLPLTGNGVNLDKIAIALSRQLKESDGESFVLKTTRTNELAQLKFDIVKHIIDVRLAENEAAKQKLEKKQQKEKIMSIIARKQDTALENTSLEDLQKMVNDL